MANVEDRATRVEARQEALDTYLPALLSAVERSQARIEGQMSALRSEVAAREERIENAVRFTRLERWALVVAIAAIPVLMIVTAVT